MRVLQINKFFYRRGGAEVHFLDLSRLLESHGHEVIHFSTRDSHNEPSPYEKFFVEGAELRGRHSLVESLKIASQVLYSFEAAKKLERLIEETKPDVAHLHNIYHHLSPSILPVLKKYQIPVVMTLHDYKLICPNYRLYTQGAICEKCQKHKYYQAIIHRCVFNQFLPSALAAMEMSFHKLWGVYEKNIDLFISPSQFLKDKMREWGIKNRMEILPNFVNPKPHTLPAKRDPPRAENPIPSRDYLLYFGRLSEEKGLLTLIEAMRLLPNIKLRLVGDGPLKEQLNNLTIEQLDNVQFVDYKSGPELAEEIAGAKAVVIPSEWYENYPLSILEAMSVGKPVIASNLGGLPEIIKDGQSGLLFKAGNSQDLAKKIKIIWSDPELAQKLGGTAKDQILAKNQPERYYQRLLGIYEQLRNK